MYRIASILVLAVCAGCASTSSGRPPNAAEYEAMAAESERAAADDLTGAQVARRHSDCAVTPNANTSACMTSEEAAWLIQAQRAKDEARDYRTRAARMRAEEGGPGRGST
jgi:hypothetical protein